MKFRVWMIALALLAGGRAALQAQDDTIALYQIVEGTIDGAPQRYTFSGHISEALSFRVEATSGDLDPILSVERDGQVLISNDDADYPDDRNALLEAISLTALGSYTVTVSAFGDTSGDFMLTMLPGYSQLAWDETFDDVSEWQALTDAVDVVAVDEMLQLSWASGVGHGVTVHSASDAWDEFNAQVNVRGVTGNDWTIGLSARGDADTYALYLINSRGEWRFSIVSPDGENVVREWVRHPAIRAGQTDFTLGIMTMGTGYNFFYNGEYIGRESSALPVGGGEIGLVVGATGANGSVTAGFDDLRVTVPARIDDGPVVPAQIMVGDAGQTIQQLLRYRLISASGELFVNIPSSSADINRPGVALIPLASGNTFTNLALGATVYSNAGADSQAGCGIALRAVDDTHYVVAYLDRTGAYGLSQRENDTFAPGIYGENPDWNDTDGHQLLVIADDTTLHYYVDGLYVGALENEPVAGGIANAAVNFEPLYTSCQFTNTWVWRWE